MSEHKLPWRITATDPKFPHHLSIVDADGRLIDLYEDMDVWSRIVAAVNACGHHKPREPEEPLKLPCRPEPNTDDVILDATDTRVVEVYYAVDRESVLAAVNDHGKLKAIEAMFRTVVGDDDE